MAARAFLQKPSILARKQDQFHWPLRLTSLPDQFSPDDFYKLCAGRLSSPFQAIQNGGLASRAQGRVSFASWFYGGHFARQPQSSLYKLKDAVVRLIDVLAYPADVPLLLHQLALGRIGSFFQDESGASAGSKSSNLRSPVPVRSVPRLGLRPLGAPGPAPIGLGRKMGEKSAKTR